MVEEIQKKSEKKTNKKILRKTQKKYSPKKRCPEAKSLFPTMAVQWKTFGRVTFTGDARGEIVGAVQWLTIGRATFTEEARD